MRSLRIAILWITGIILWVFGLSIGLAWYDFGYLDLGTVATMGLIMLPLLAVAIGVLIWTRIHESTDEEESAVRPGTPLVLEHPKEFAAPPEIKVPAEGAKQNAATTAASRELETVEKGESR